MNMSKLTLCFVVLFLNVFINNAFAASSVWKVSKGGNHFYLGGTIHMLTADDHPLPHEFLTAYRHASEIFFETDLDAINVTEFQSTFITAMTYDDHDTLKNNLNSKIYRKLKRFLVSRNLSITSFSKYRPWGVALTLTMMEYQHLGLKSGYGVDTYFNRLALKDNKKRNSLETPKEQLAAIMSMANIDPNESIEYTLRDIDNLPEFIHLMKGYWRNGNTEGLALNSIVMQMKIETPTIYKALVIERNNNWMRKLSTLNNDRDKEFVLVGALHLVGEEGLLNQLKNKGFIVEPL